MHPLLKKILDPPLIRLKSFDWLSHHGIENVYVRKIGWFEKRPGKYGVKLKVYRGVWKIEVREIETALDRTIIGECSHYPMTFVNQDPILITSNCLQGRIVWLQSSVSVVKANFKFHQTSSPRKFTAPFNNMRTLKFEAQPTNGFFAAVNQVFGGSS